MCRSSSKSHKRYKSVCKLFIRFHNRAHNMSGISRIEFAPNNPVELFNALLKHVRDEYIIMNIATIDSEFGPMNRSVLFRRMMGNALLFVTERNSRKYQNLCKDNRISATLTFANIPAQANAPVSETPGEAHWQVRVFDAYAEELSEQEIAKFWPNEPLFAKIRSHLMECGVPADVDKLKHEHDTLQKEFESGKNELPQTKTYTAFKIIPNRWDFYMALENCIGDRVQYRKQVDASWKMFHVCT